MKVVLLFAVQYALWAIMTCYLLTQVARSWHRKQYRLFGLNMTAAICTIAMLLKLLMI